jgi:hypothetical protein
MVASPEASVGVYRFCQAVQAGGVLEVGGLNLASVLRGGLTGRRALKVPSDAIETVWAPGGW